MRPPIRLQRAFAARRASERAVVGIRQPGSRPTHFRIEGRKEIARQKREQQLSDLCVRLQTERSELNTVTQTVHQMQADFDQNVLRIQEEEVANLKKLAKVYAAMTPETAANIFAEMDDTPVVKIMVFMKDGETAGIFESLAKKGQPSQARRQSFRTTPSRRLPQYQLPNDDPIRFRHRPPRFHRAGRCRACLRAFRHLRTRGGCRFFQPDSEGDCESSRQGSSAAHRRLNRQNCEAGIAILRTNARVCQAAQTSSRQRRPTRRLINRMHQTRFRNRPPISPRPKRATSIRPSQLRIMAMMLPASPLPLDNRECQRQVLTMTPKLVFDERSAPTAPTPATTDHPQSVASLPSDDLSPPLKSSTAD